MPGILILWAPLGIDGAGRTVAAVDIEAGGTWDTSLSGSVAGDEEVGWVCAGGDDWTGA